MVLHFYYASCVSAELHIHCFQNNVKIFIHDMKMLSAYFYLYTNVKINKEVFGDTNVMS